MSVKERKTLHSPRCAECGEMLFCEFDDEELKQLVAVGASCSIERAPPAT
jgi:hypothetical protein